MDVLTVGERTLRCSGIEFIQLDMSNRHPINVEILFEDKKLIGFKLQLRSDIKKLGGLVWFYGISTIEGYFMPNPVYILDIYDL